MSRDASSVPRPIDLNHVVLDRCEALGWIADAEHPLELDLAEGLPPVWADPHRVGDVLVALVSVTRSSMSERGTIRIATRLLGQGDQAPAVGPRRISLAVCPGGGAPPPAHLLEVGTVCAVHFTVFPDGLDSASGNGTDQPAWGARRFGGIGPKDRAILLVEDDVTVLEILTAALVRTGHKVVTAPDGVAALQRFLEEERAQRPIAVLVTDVVMPRMDGFALAEYATAITPDLGVVFITGYRDRTAPAGAVLLQKPFSPEALFRLVWEKLEVS
jgi:CheY-like chemotaxis protein